MNRLGVCVVASVVASAVVSTALVLTLRQEHKCAWVESQERHRRMIAEGRKRDPFPLIQTGTDNSEILEPGCYLTVEAILPQERKLTKVAFKMPTTESLHAEWATVDWNEGTCSYLLNLHDVSGDDGQSLWGALGCHFPLRESAHNTRVQSGAAAESEAEAEATE